MTNIGAYEDCYVAFLDILGFRQLVQRSTTDAALFSQISGITTLAATPQSGIKQTSLGPCLMQIRAFSDSIVVFTPTNHANDNACNPLAQLCFIVRYLHDRVLEMGACIRGGITRGKMYWHPAWSNTEAEPERGTCSALPITFGPGLNAAYDLENDHAVYPRVLICDSIRNGLCNDLSASPLADNGIKLHQCFRTDPKDTKVHLDLLNSRIVRAEREKMTTLNDGFTVKWDNNAESTHTTILEKATELADKEIKAYEACKQIRKKYEWLREYCRDSIPETNGSSQGLR